MPNNLLVNKILCAISTEYRANEHEIILCMLHLIGLREVLHHGVLDSAEK